MTVLRDFSEINFSSKNFRNAFHENLTDSLVADTGSQTNERKWFPLNFHPLFA